MVKRKLMDKISTHRMSQDHLEMYFGKIRSMNGFNNNPTCEQFNSAVRKLLASNSILISKYANCSDLGLTMDQTPYSNIGSVSSRRQKTSSTSVTNEYFEEGDVESLLQQLAVIQELSLEASKDNIDMEDFTVAHIAGIIETKIINSSRFKCDHCKTLLANDAKIQSAFQQNTMRKPCQNTFEICKATNHFVKLELLKGQFTLDSIKFATRSSLDLEHLYEDADFSEDCLNNKLFLIDYIISLYLQIKGTYLAKSVNEKENQINMRQKLSKLILFKNT